MKICVCCNQLYHDETNFCPTCGTKLEIYVEKKICANCGTELDEDMYFCPQCGKKIDCKVIDTSDTFKTENTDVDKFNSKATKKKSLKYWEMIKGLFSAQGLFSINGRRNREPYIWFRLLFIVPFSNSVTKSIEHCYDNSVVVMGMVIVLIIDALGCINDIKRSHDLGISTNVPLCVFGSYVVGVIGSMENEQLGLLCIIQVAYQFYLMFKKGDEGTNKYGPDPLIP